MHFYIPRTKRELVSFLKQRYPGMPFAEWTKKHLLAMYINWRLING